MQRERSQVSTVSERVVITVTDRFFSWPAARDPYAIDDDDLVMVDKEDADDQSPKEGSRGSAPSKRKSKREVRMAATGFSKATFDC